MVRTSLLTAAAVGAIVAFGTMPSYAQQKGGEEKQEFQPRSGAGGDQIGRRGGEERRFEGQGKEAKEGKGGDEGNRRVEKSRGDEEKFREEGSRGKFKDDDERRKFSGKSRDDDDRKFRWRQGKREEWRDGRWVVIVGVPSVGLVAGRCHFHKWPGLSPSHRSVRCDHWHGWHRSISVVD
jgi:hypothetical protein